MVDTLNCIIIRLGSFGIKILMRQVLEFLIGYATTV